MEAIPWVTISHIAEGSSCFKSYDAVFDSLKIDPQSTPTVVSFVGKHEKSKLLRHLIDTSELSYPLLPHGQVYLWADNATRNSRAPIVFLDCELQNSNSARWKDPILYESPEISRQLSWLPCCDHGTLVSLFSANVLEPLSSIICYFLEDFGTLKDIAQQIADRLLAPSILDSRSAILPDVLIVAQEPNSNSDPDAAQRLLEHFIERQREESTRSIRNCYRSIRVTYLKRDNQAAKAEQLHTKLIKVQEDVLAVREAKRLLFGFTHTRTFAALLLQKFCNNPKAQFSLIAASRPKGYTSAEFHIHLQELMEMLPSEAWLWHVVAPLVAWCIAYASYPHGAHRKYDPRSADGQLTSKVFDPGMLFKELFRNTCRKAIEGYAVQTVVQDKFLTAVETELRAQFSELVAETDPRRATITHRKSLLRIQHLLKELKTNKTCLVCLLRMPERVLSCGHSICEVDIRAFGERSCHDRHNFVVHECPICGEQQDKLSFRFVPPTAGVRILALDGGGVRGIIPLLILSDVEERLGVLGCHLSEYFDLVCGTSVGKSCCSPFDGHIWLTVSCRRPVRDWHFRSQLDRQRMRRES